MQEEYVIIELSQADAQAFILFQKYYKKIKYLIEKGAFDHADGSVQIHINGQGRWRNVVLVKNNYPIDGDI